MLTQRDILFGLRDLGIRDGDAVLVHSSYKTVGPVEGGPQTVITALELAVGPFGTIVMPTFTFENQNSGVSEMGILTRLVAADPRSSHIPHPIHSFSVLGYFSDCWGKIRNTSSYGSDSIFAHLTEVNGKILIVGLNWNSSMTYFHYVEQSVGVPYRELQPIKDHPQYTIYARKPGVVTQVDPMGDLLERSGIVAGKTIGHTLWRVVSARRVYEFVKVHLPHACGLLYDLNA